MELGLSLGDASKSLSFLKEKQNPSKKSGLDFLLGLTSKNNESGKAQKFLQNDEDNDGGDEDSDDRSDDNQETQTPLQLNLLPLASRLCSSDNGSSENGSSANMGLPAAKGLEVNRTPAAEEVSSANSVGSPFRMEFSMYGSNPPLGGNKREFEAARNDNAEAQRGSDDEDNGVNARKKLRLSKEQSAFLEESFKEHNTLNPKQKLALAKQLNLRPRQVEVWFQNRRARTKLKQTEVDCEYLKRCCDTHGRKQKTSQRIAGIESSEIFESILHAEPSHHFNHVPLLRARLNHLYIRASHRHRRKDRRGGGVDA